MSKAKINPRGSSWDELEKQLFTPEKLPKVKYVLTLKYVFAEDTLSRRENNDGNNILCLNLINCRKSILKLNKITFIS